MSDAAPSKPAPPPVVDSGPAPEPPNGILARMLDRLFAAITSGPSLSCRPHASRQRLDLTQFDRLGDIPPGAILAGLLGPEGSVKVTARIPNPPPAHPSPRNSPTSSETGDPAQTDDAAAAARRAWNDQQSLLAKLRIIAEEARTYEDDTGVSTLAIGFPLLSMPAGTARRGQMRRILAPIAFIPVTLTTRTGAAPSIELACRNDNAERVSPNEALLAWIEQQTGTPEPELFADDEGGDPWREIAGLVAHIASAAGAALPPAFALPTMPRPLDLAPAPRAEDQTMASIVPGAVLGLFPVANQGLLRDTQAMLGGERHAGPIESFLRADAALTAPRADAPEPAADAGRAAIPRRFADERLIAPADPCQGRAVALARQSPALVVHGPPGTGKSQTITNIIGDHLARGERVLFVCEKRTALDVVYNRLEHLGLGSLCALIHDPQRDQRGLYMAIREQLEGLAEAGLHPRAAASLAKADAELQQLHAELTAHHRRLTRAHGDDEPSFHDLVGRWLAIPDDSAAPLEPRLTANLHPNAVEAAALTLNDILSRALDAAFPSNPWVAAAGIGLDQFLSRPMDSIREALRAAAIAAQTADATREPDMPPFTPDHALIEQGAERLQLADRLARAAAQPGAIRARWAGADPKAIARARKALGDAAPVLKAIREGTLDRELVMAIHDRLPTAPEVAAQLAALQAYLAGARSWYGFVFFGRRAAAARVLGIYGLPLAPEPAERLTGFLTALRALFAGAALLESFGEKPPPGLPDASEIDAAASAHAAVIEALAALDQPMLAPLRPLVAGTLAGDSSAAEPLIGALRRSPVRAQSLQRLESAIESLGFFAEPWQRSRSAEFRAGAEAMPILSALQSSLPTLEGVLRIADGLAHLAEPLRSAAAALVNASATPGQGLAALRKAALGSAISRRLATDPELRSTDARRLETVFARIRELEDAKLSLARDAILNTWTSRQQSRLLVGTGSRLNSAGAEVRRRLTVRGRRAMRLRQVLAMGRSADGGDPIMDLRPIWMASPETVAQVFPREPVFDAVVFDEASQCRLEEALPVLTRARRIVIAGDPKQLPPTRFFESAIAASDTDEIETDQQLFEAQQGEVEDLLGAALNLDIQSCYLDVHYRSRNADLIAFSNEQFYSSRLQPIPAHPAGRAPTSPITLHRAGGTYDNRVNEAEAAQVCRIVRELLAAPKPPSIGIGCFNLAQRDLIAGTLEEAAGADPAFAQRLAIARDRRGQASFEGLFVKNLENVQGDERDHIIISTTYGPDPKGRFYRRFGPLAMPGGGRRLNVLVTRARQHIHVVTSIPPEAYASLPPVPAGQSAGGGWLLFAYLAYADALEQAYSPAIRPPSGLDPRSSSAGLDGPSVTIRPSRWPSPLAESLAALLAARTGVSSEVYWGNDGFCVDVAARHPDGPDDVTIGILCDGSRYALADDPVQWDLFRTAILESQGWSLRRVWSPACFRDPAGTAEAIRALAAGGDPRRPG